MDKAEVVHPAPTRSKKGILMKEEIIYATKGLENEEEEEEEVEEIVEIIEEIEEIEEIVEEEVEDPKNMSESVVNSEIIREPESPTEKTDRDITENRSNDESQKDLGREDEQSVKFKSSNRHPEHRSYERRKKSAVVTYDADEDWEDEENEQSESRSTRSGKNNISDGSPSLKKNHSINGKRSASSRDDIYSTSERTNTEPVHKVAKTRASMNYFDARNISKSLETEENEEDEEESQQEIVKSAENNLVYTVLGSKKQTSTSTKTKKDTPMSRTQDSARYMKLVHDDVEQYQYEGQTAEQEEQEWEGTNEGTSENQAEEEEEDESIQQDQIFLHEDEDGQLYFKDDSGTLQPVYLTADGNYAIAENSSDEQEVHDNTANNRETTLTPSRPAEGAKGFDDESFIVPELDNVASSSNPNDPDDADNTVTISLIISEDENGQKRTQVIIPTTDNLKCDLCSKTFKTSFQLLRHNRLKHAREEDITTRNFPCDLCPKRYSDQNTLARHRKTHLGDRPFGCLECGKSFPTSTALRRHLTQHNPQSRPLPCIYCGRRFLEKSALTKHEQSHLAGDQRTHTCDICHKSFLQAADLNLHKKNHDPDKKFDCEVCGREFNRLNNLQRHMMVHKQKQGGNQEILACDVCGITYKFMSSLTRHMVTSHMNPEKLRQQAEEQRKKRENNYRRYLENRKMYETQHSGPDYSSSGKRASGYRSSNENDEDTA